MTVLMRKCLTDLLDSIGSFLSLLRFLSFVGSPSHHPSIWEHRVMEVLNFDCFRPFVVCDRGHGSRGNWCEARSFAWRESPKLELSVASWTRMSPDFARLSCRASKLATTWALESQVGSAAKISKTFLNQLRFKEIFKIFFVFLFLVWNLKGLLSLLVLLYRIQWHAIATFCSCTRIFLAPLRRCGEDNVQGGTRDVWFCGLYATTATRENQSVCCGGTPFMVILATSITGIHLPQFPLFFMELIQMISSCFMSCQTSQDDGGASPRPGHPTWPWRTSTQHLPVRVAKGWEGFGRVFRCLRPNDIGQWNLEVDELMSWCSFHNSFHHHFMLGKLWFQRCSPRSAVRSPPRIHMLIQEAERFNRATQVTRIAASRVLRLSRRTNSRCPISMRRPKLQTSNITFAILQDLNVLQDERYHEETSQFFTYIDTSLMLQYDTIYSMI